ncbi:hypothetical protein R3P38DRAFT_3271313, partial [Favolaschia claudopus]
MSIPPPSHSFSEIYRPQRNLCENRNPNNNSVQDSVPTLTVEHGARLLDNAQPGIPEFYLGDSLTFPQQPFNPYSNYGFMYPLPQQWVNTEFESSVTNSIASLDELLSTSPLRSPRIENPRNLSSQSQARMDDHSPQVDPLFVGDAGPQNLVAKELSSTTADPPNIYIDSLPPVADDTPDACYTFLLQTMSEQKIDVHTFVASMLNAGHLDASRLRDIISRSSGGHLTIPSGRRRRNIPRKQHKCSGCGTQETTQWRRHPQNGMMKPFASRDSQHGWQQWEVSAGKPEIYGSTLTALVRRDTTSSSGHIFRQPHRLHDPMHRK